VVFPRGCWSGRQDGDSDGRPRFRSAAHELESGRAGATAEAAGPKRATGKGRKTPDEEKCPSSSLSYSQRPTDTVKLDGHSTRPHTLSLVPLRRSRRGGLQHRRRQRRRRRRRQLLWRRWLICSKEIVSQSSSTSRKKRGRKGGETDKEERGGTNEFSNWRPPKGRARREGGRRKNEG
jgi:hypothetical protein